MPNAGTIDKYLKFTKYGLLILLFFFFSFNSIAEITMSIYPTPVVAGEESSLIINSSEGKAEIKDLPFIDNLQWLNSNVQSQNLMIINNVRYVKTSYPFIVKKPGKIILPAMTVTVEGKKELNTAEKEILVSTGPLSDLESMLFIKCEYPADKKQYYVGEDIPMKVNIYKSTELNADPVEYPQIKMNNIIFDEFKNNPQSDKFAPYPYGTPEKVTIDGIDYIKTTFYTSFRSLAEGDLKGIASIAFRIKLSNSKRSGADSFFEDSFFSSSFFGSNNFTTRIIDCKIPDIKIMPLPSVPADSNYLGLIGNWNVTSEVKYDKLKEGEPITVSLNISGYGSTENLNPPEINVPGFTSYSPEVLNDNKSNKGKQNIKIDYVLIPTESGKTNLNIDFCTFNINSGSYKEVSVKKQFDIQKGEDQGVKSAYLTGSGEIVKKTQTKVSNSILYISITPGNSIDVPLYKNHLFSILFLLILGPVLLIFFELFRFRKKYITGTKGFERKNKASKCKNSIIKKIRQSKNMKELADTVQHDVIPYINDINDYPPGTTVNDLGKKILDENLIQPLKDAETSAFMPGHEGDTEELKKKILKIVKHFSMFALVFTVLFFASNNNMFGQENAITSPVTEFTKFYNSGKFDEALKVCETQINMSAPNSAWIYNLGNCYYQKGDLAKALVYYERALRLEPRNSDILENLNFVRRKLFMPEVYQTKTPYELVIFLRDHLRPDEWLLIFAIGWFFIFAGLILRRKCPARVWISICSVALFICIASAGAYLSELSSLYSSQKAVVVERNVKVFTLPTKESSDAGFSLNSGDIINIEENLQNWIRVRKGKSEGWINEKTAEQIWPY